MSAESATITSTLLTQINQVIKMHPYHKACGFDVIEQAPGRAVTRFLLNDFTLNTAGFLHGGVLYGLLDVSGFLAAAPTLAPHEQIVTHDFHASILSPVSKQYKPTIQATIERRGKAIIFIHCDAWAEAVNGNKKKFAIATVVKSVVTNRYAKS